MKDFNQGNIARRLLRPAGEGLRDPVEELYPAFGVGNDDAVADTDEGSVQQLALFMDRGHGPRAHS